MNFLQLQNLQFNEGHKKFLQLLPFDNASARRTRSRGEAKPVGDGFEVRRQYPAGRVGQANEQFLAFGACRKIQVFRPSEPGKYEVIYNVGVLCLNSYGNF